MISNNQQLVNDSTKMCQKYCCQRMSTYSANEGGLIQYCPYFREYSVKVGDNILQQIQYTFSELKGGNLLKV